MGYQLMVPDFLVGQHYKVAMSVGLLQVGTHSDMTLDVASASNNNNNNQPLTHCDVRPEGARTPCCTQTSQFEGHVCGKLLVDSDYW